MNIATWLTVVAIVMLGAMSPGPSLAVVLRHTLSGGRRHGCTAAIAHGAGGTAAAGKPAIKNALERSRLAPPAQAMQGQRDS